VNIYVVRRTDKRIEYEDPVSFAVCAENLEKAVDAIFDVEDDHYREAFPPSRWEAVLVGTAHAGLRPGRLVEEWASA